MTDFPNDVLIVGGSAAGLSTAEALRRNQFAGSITVLSGEDHLPYDRPPLSKQVMSGAWDPSRTMLRTPEHLNSLDVDFILGGKAVSLDTETCSVTTDSGEKISADAIVVATGANPRTLSGDERAAGVHVLRTLDDARALRNALSPETRLVVVGDGVLGCEIAATAAGLGVAVTITGPHSSLMATQLGLQVSDLLSDVHRQQGVRLQLDTTVSGLAIDGDSVTGVYLDSGDVLDADVVVVAIGAVPATEWLQGSGLTLDDGVVCDSRCRAAKGVYAVGDVARWWHGNLGAYVRLDNRTNATEQAAAVAEIIMGKDKAYVPVPYFWTDQFGAKIQVYGSVPPDAAADIVEGDVSDGRFVTQYTRDGDVTGIVGWNMPKQSRMHGRRLISDTSASGS